MKSILFWGAIVGFCWLVGPSVGVPIVAVAFGAAFLVAIGSYIGRSGRRY